MIFVTGITGHTGRWFFKRLVEESYPGPIRCAVRNGSDTSLFKDCSLDLEVVHGDLNDLSFLKNTMSGVDTVLHISSIFFSQNIVEAALDNGVKWTILVHTTGRYSKYKGASEEYIRIEDGVLQKRDQMGITILRPTMIYGSSRDRNMYRLVDFLYRHRFFPLFGDGNNLMQPVHARDLGNAYFDVLKNREKTFNRDYNLSGRSPITYRELVECVSRELKSRNTILKIPLWASIFGARAYNAISKCAPVSVEQVLRMQEDKSFSHKDARQDFGFKPVSFEEGIKEEIIEFLEIQKNHKNTKRNKNMKSLRY